MSALGFKQLPRSGGYYINVADARTTFYQNNGTDFAPLISANQFARSSITSSFLATGGSAILRDHGKTLTSSGRVFRKVQLMVSTGLVYATLGGIQSGGAISGGTDGVGGFDGINVNTTPNYLTGYIELPGQGGSGNGGVGFTPVARLG